MLHMTRINPPHDRYPIASAAEIQTAREANTLTWLPRSYGGPRNKNTGFVSGPLVSSNPQVADKFPDVALAFAMAAEAAASSSEAEAPTRPPMPPQYESNPKTEGRAESPALPPAAPITPLNSVVSSTDPIHVLVVDDDGVTRVLSSKCVARLYPDCPRGLLTVAAP